jgi:pyruvate/2-oxoglutarate dehydrogenase complex dihydrolipoamide dehydrogenase (E3) component
VGSGSFRPPIPGVEGKNVITAVDAYYGHTAIGETVVVIGGGLVGCETGLYLAESGKKVTIVEMLDVIGDPLNWRHTLPLVRRMNNTPTLSYRTSLKCVEITSSSIKVADGKGKEQIIEADTVVLAAGMLSNTDTVEQLRGCVSNFYPIGDCVKPQKIREAMQGGYFTALDIF